MYYIATISFALREKHTLHICTRPANQNKCWRFMSSGMCYCIIA